MAKYLISFPRAAMVVPDGELGAVGRDARAVIDEAKAAGVYVFGGGIDEDVPPVLVSADGAVAMGGYPWAPTLDGGFTMLKLPSRDGFTARLTETGASTCEHPKVRIGRKPPTASSQNQRSVIRAHMKIREYMATRRRVFIGIGIASWLGFAGSIILIPRVEARPWFSLIFFGGFAAAILGIMFLLKCSRCGGALGFGSAPFTGERTTGIYRRLNFCPYCGISLDEPYVEAHGP
jgi:hypothetical protein